MSDTQGNLFEKTQQNLSDKTEEMSEVDRAPAILFVIPCKSVNNDCKELIQIIIANIFPTFTAKQRCLSSENVPAPTFFKVQDDLLSKNLIQGILIKSSLIQSRYLTNSDQQFFQIDQQPHNKDDDKNLLYIHCLTLNSGLSSNSFLKKEIGQQSSFKSDDNRVKQEQQLYDYYAIIILSKTQLREKEEISKGILHLLDKNSSDQLLILGTKSSPQQPAPISEQAEQVIGIEQIIESIQALTPVDLNQLIGDFSPTQDKQSIEESTPLIHLESQDSTVFSQQSSFTPSAQTENERTHADLLKSKITNSVNSYFNNLKAPQDILQGISMVKKQFLQTSIGYGLIQKCKQAAIEKRKQLGLSALQQKPIIKSGEDDIENPLEIVKDPLLALSTSIIQSKLDKELGPPLEKKPSHATCTQIKTQLSPSESHADAESLVAEVHEKKNDEEQDEGKQVQVQPLSSELLPHGDSNPHIETEDPPIETKVPSIETEVQGKNSGNDVCQTKKVNPLPVPHGLLIPVSFSSRIPIIIAQLLSKIFKKDQSGNLAKRRKVQLVVNTNNRAEAICQTIDLLIGANMSAELRRDRLKEIGITEGTYDFKFFKFLSQKKSKKESKVDLDDIYSNHDVFLTLARQFKTHLDHGDVQMKYLDVLIYDEGWTSTKESHVNQIQTQFYFNNEMTVNQQNKIQAIPDQFSIPYTLAFIDAKTCLSESFDISVYQNLQKLSNIFNGELMKIEDKQKAYAANLRQVYDLTPNYQNCSNYQEILKTQLVKHQQALKLLEENEILLKQTITYLLLFEEAKQHLQKLEETKQQCDPSLSEATTTDTENERASVYVETTESVFEEKKLEKCLYFTTKEEERKFFKSAYTAKATIYESKRILDEFFKRYFEIIKEKVKLPAIKNETLQPGQQMMIQAKPTQQTTAASVFNLSQYIAKVQHHIQNKRYFIAYIKLDYQLEPLFQEFFNKSREQVNTSFECINFFSAKQIVVITDDKKIHHIKLEKTEDTPQPSEQVSEMDKKDRLNAKSFIKEKESESYVYLQLLHYLYQKGFLDNFLRLKEDKFSNIGGKDPESKDPPDQVKVEEGNQVTEQTPDGNTNQLSYTSSQTTGNASNIPAAQSSDQNSIDNKDTMEIEEQKQIEFSQTVAFKKIDNFIGEELIPVLEKVDEYRKECDKLQNKDQKAATMDWRINESEQYQGTIKSGITKEGFEKLKKYVQGLRIVSKCDQVNQVEFFLSSQNKKSMIGKEILANYLEIYKPVVSNHIMYNELEKYCKIIISPKGSLFENDGFKKLAKKIQEGLGNNCFFLPNYLQKIPETTESNIILMLIIVALNWKQIAESSFIRDEKGRLEFIGDSAMNLCVLVSLMFKKELFGKSEGEIDKLKSDRVNVQSIYKKLQHT